MKGVNKVSLIGNVGKEPVIKQLENGKMASFSLATAESWKDKATGEKREQTEWHNCVVFGALSGVVEGYVKKGSKLYVEGSLSTTSYEKDGEKRYITQIKVRDLVMLDSKNDGVKANTEKVSSGSYDKAQQGVPFDDEIPF